MSADIWWSIGLVFLFIIIGGIFAGTEIALVSLRPSQVDQLAKKGKRGSAPPQSRAIRTASSLQCRLALR